MLPTPILTVRLDTVDITAAELRFTIITTVASS